MTMPVTPVCCVTSLGGFVSVLSVHFIGMSPVRAPCVAPSWRKVQKSLNTFIEDAKHVMRDFRECLPARSSGRSWWSALMSQSGSSASSSSAARADLEESSCCTVDGSCCASCVS